VVGAVVHALQEYGVRHLDMPLTPEKLWRAISAGDDEGQGEADR
jgi:carbon-monoxide dehydrogenase large subunit